MRNNIIKQPKFKLEEIVVVYKTICFMKMIKRITQIEIKNAYYDGENWLYQDKDSGNYEEKEIMRIKRHE